MSNKNEISVKKLEKRLHKLKTENEELKKVNLIISNEVQTLKDEIDRIREPPLVGAVVVKVLDQEKSRVVVASSEGPFFVVNLSQKVKNEEIKAGIIVALNLRTFAVMEILPITAEELKKMKELIFLTELTLKKD